VEVVEGVHLVRWMGELWRDSNSNGVGVKEEVLPRMIRVILAFSQAPSSPLETTLCLSSLHHLSSLVNMLFFNPSSTTRASTSMISEFRQQLYPAVSSTSHSPHPSVHILTEPSSQPPSFRSEHPPNAAVEPPRTGVTLPESGSASRSSAARSPPSLIFPN